MARGLSEQRLALVKEEELVLHGIERAAVEPQWAEASADVKPEGMGVARCKKMALVSVREYSLEHSVEQDQKKMGSLGAPSVSAAQGTYRDPQTG